MRMYIMREEKVAVALNGIGKSVKQTVDEVKVMRIYCFVGIDLSGREMSSLVDSMLERYREEVKRRALLRGILEYTVRFPMFALGSVKSGASSFESMFAICNPYDRWNSYIDGHRDNFAHSDYDFLRSQIRACVHQTGSNHSCLRESSLHLQKTNTLTRYLSALQATLSPYSIHTGFSIFATGDSHLFVSEHHAFFWSKAQQLYGKPGSFCLAKKVSGCRAELRKRAQLRHHNLPNQYLKRRDFSSGFMILTLRITRTFRACSRHALVSRMIFPPNLELGSADCQEDFGVSLSIAAFVEFVWIF